MDFARLHREELGITRQDQIIPVTSERQLRARRGQRLIILEDCFFGTPGNLELLMYARHAGLDIVYRNCRENR